MKTPEFLLATAMECAASDDNLGVCVDCGEVQGGCEPDARMYECEACGEMSVFGAEEIIIAGGKPSLEDYGTNR